MGFDRPGISFEFAPAPAGFKWEKQEDGRYKLIYIKLLNLFFGKYMLNL